MSIKAKLSTACLLLILVNLSVGVFSHVAQQRMGELGFDIYDRAFMAMSYLRSSQNGLARLRATTHRPASNRDGLPPGTEAPAAASTAPRPEIAAAAAILRDARDDVEIARQRAMSDEGATAAKDIGARLERLQAELQTRQLAPTQAEVVGIQDAFDTAVEIFAGDGYLYRRKVQDLVDVSSRDAVIAVAISAAVACIITFALWRSMMPALRSAVAIARSISVGRLDNAFPIRGSGEMAILLRTLSSMQDSLVDKIARIDALAIEAETRAVERAAESDRFEAALDNMRHGLCMVDAAQRIIVANRRLSEMFGAPPPLGSDLADWRSLPVPPEGLVGGDPTARELPDGRMIRVACQPVLDGGWVVAFEDITERHRAESKLIHMARYDALTGLPNRVLFHETLERLVSESPSISGPAVLYVDLDGFKTVNDTLGHAVGDELLRAASERLRSRLRTCDMVARLGGDEFAMILRTGDEGSAERRAAELVEAFRQPFDCQLQRVSVGASVGVAVRRQGDAADVADACATLLKNADVALYRAKADGRSTYRMHSDALDAATLDRRWLEADLRTALERDEFTLAYQPIVAATDSQVTGFEALIRWNHPERGLVPPGTFIPVAEETGLIGPIGRWVLEAACQEASTWPGDLRVAVNLSPVQFKQGFLAADVVRALADGGLAPGRLVLEITESVLIQDSASVGATLAQLRTLGVRIALDDFGTGYSSLSYLRKFKFDKLKIDRSFLQNLCRPEDLAIFRAITSLARALDLPVVAEGVETAEQAERLKAEGCLEFQGFYFGRPGPVDAALVARSASSRVA